MPAPESPVDEESRPQPDSRFGRLVARAQAIAVTVIEFVRVMPGGGLLIRILGDIARGNITDRAMTLAAQAFTGILPIVILLTTLPGSSVIDTSLAKLGIHGGNVDFLSSADTTTVGTFGLIGALMTIAGATSLSRALGRMYVSIWQVTKLPLKGWWRWVVVIFTIPVAVTVQGMSTDLSSNTIFGVHIDDSGLLGIGLVIVVTFLIWTITWTLVPRLLVSAQVPLRLLTLNGAVTGALITVLMVGSRVVMPRIMNNTTQHYGTLGVVFIAISWLFIFAGILVVTALVTNAVITDDGAVGSWIRNLVGSPTPMPKSESPRWYQPTI